jgi:ATP-dependent DNA helicase RecG
MRRTDLLELIQNGENSGVEFKRDTIENRALAKESERVNDFETPLTRI